VLRIGGVLRGVSHFPLWVSVALLAGVAGCAGQTNTTATVAGSTLSIYAGQPPGGSGSRQAQDVLDAERLALQQSGSQVGRFRINFVLADSSKT
jgi:hypothetical protein